MKDKLLHTGHKKLYYRLRFAFIALFSLLALAGLSATPIAITYSIAMANAARADNAGSNASAAQALTFEVASYIE